MLRADQRLANRARTAIGRSGLSRPLKCAIADGLINAGTELFDYGCGRGDDLRQLAALGYTARGWDPVHRPDSQRCSAPIVNMGYVVNVIENVNERREAIEKAWSLAKSILIVSARSTLDSRALRGGCNFGDGCLTSRGTFQKFYEQQELRHWIDQTLEVSSVPAAPGVFYVFREEPVRAAFVAARYRRQAVAPSLTRSAKLYTDHEKLLVPLMEFVNERGRLPSDGELANVSAIIDVFGSIRKAFRVILIVTEDKRWNEIFWERRQDLLIYLALSHFDRRPSFGCLPLSSQRDVRAFFGVYKKACSEADELLFSLGKPGLLDEACRGSPIGKLTTGALYAHESALSALPPLLRLYEGCARGYLGRVEGANIIKLHRGEPRISYLSYPSFDADPHPVLTASLSVHLQTFRVKTRDYTCSRNRPVLHRKELFVPPDYPEFEKFARLTRIEESKGLYEDTSRIGLEQGWRETLDRKGFFLRGHRLLAAGGPRS